MLKKILITNLIIITVFLSGCSVWMDAEYQDLLNQSASLSRRYSDLADANELSSEEMKEVLELQAGWWEEFQNAN